MNIEILIIRSIVAYAVSLKDAPVDQESRFQVKMNCEMSVFWLGLIARLGHIVTTGTWMSV